MRASALKYAILSVMANMVLVVISLMPLYGFMTVWGSSLIGHYTALRLWGEVFLLISCVGLVYLLLMDRMIRGHTVTRMLVWLILLYGLVNILWGLIAYNRHDVDLKALGYGLIVDLRFPAFFLITWSVALRASRLRAHWQKLILWPAFIVVIFGLLQAFFLPYNFLSHFGYGPKTIPAYETINSNLHYIRIASTLRGADPLGAYLLIPISLLTILICRRQRRWSYLAFLLAALATLYFSYARSAWVGAVLSIGVILFLSLHTKQTKKLALWICCLVLLVLATSAYALRNNTHVQNILLHTQTHSTVATTSDQNHSSALKSGLQDMLHKPLGDGPGSAGPASIYNNHPARIAENYYIQIGQETGWLGLILFLLINAAVGYLLWLRRADPLALCLFASLIGLSFVNMLSHAWADVTLAYVWWGLAGIAMAPIVKKSGKTEV
jgi:hypothetical protein